MTAVDFWFTVGVCTVIVLGIVGFSVVFGFYWGRNTVDHEMHLELMRTRQLLDRALDENKIQTLRIEKLENNGKGN